MQICYIFMRLKKPKARPKAQKKSRKFRLSKIKIQHYYFFNFAL